MEIKNVGVVGCGLMGSGIVELCARKGYSVIVREINDDFLNKGLDRIKSSMAYAVKKEKMTAADQDAAWALSWARRTSQTSPTSISPSKPQLKISI